MPLLGSAALLLSFDVAPEAVEEHDRWHTHEHLPERLSIPGFRRGTRWIAVDGGPRHMVLYEVENLQVLSSDAYLARLNDPSPWTTRMMPHYRGMRRGLCTVAGSFGLGQGGDAALIRFAAEPVRAEDLHRWLLVELIPGLPRLPGLGSAHLLRGAAAAAMTSEQRIRGADLGMDSAVIVTGYDGGSVAASAQQIVEALPSHGGVDVACAAYQSSYSLAAAEIDA